MIMANNDFDDIFGADPKPKPVEPGTHPAVADLIREREKSIPLPGARVMMAEGSKRKKVLAKPIEIVSNDPDDPMIDPEKMIIYDIDSLKSHFHIGQKFSIDEKGYYGRKLFVAAIHDGDLGGIIFEDESENMKGNKWANMKICFAWPPVKHYLDHKLFKARD